MLTGTIQTIEYTARSSRRELEEILVRVAAGDQDALAILGDQERKIVMLHAISGLKHREIAELLELPLATVLSKYHRALKKLRVFMKGDNAS